MLHKISSDDPFRLLRGNNHQLCLQIAALTISQETTVKLAKSYNTNLICQLFLA